MLDPEDKRPIKTLPLRQPIVVSPNGSLLELINVFQVRLSSFFPLSHQYGSPPPFILIPQTHHNSTHAQEGRSHMAIVSPCPDLTRQALRAGKSLEGRLAPIGACACAHG